MCQAIRPRLEALVAQHFAAVALAYVDSRSTGLVRPAGRVQPAGAAFYVQGQLALEWARSFSLHEVAAQMERVLALAGDATAPAQL